MQLRKRYFALPGARMGSVQCLVLLLLQLLLCRAESLQKDRDSACDEPVEVADDPIDLRFLAGENIEGSVSVSVLWVSHEMVANYVTVQRCRTESTLQIRVSMPFNRMPQLREQVLVGRGWSQSVAACSDGVDNDGDGLTDLVDPGCRGSMATETEHGETKVPSNFKASFATDTRTGNTYLQQLKWKSQVVIIDDGTQGNRFFLHGDSGTTSGLKYTSDIEIYAEGVQPWLPNSNFSAANAPINSTSMEQVVSNFTNGTDWAAVVTETADLVLADHFRFEGDSIYITTNITSKRSSGVVAPYVPLVLGNLQLGRTATGCDCSKLITVYSAKSPADGHGEAGNCTASCKSGLFHVDRLRHGGLQQGQPWDNTSPDTCCPPVKELTGWRTMPARGNSYPSSSYSPVTVVGGATPQDFTVGMQVLSAQINPDQLDNTTVEFYDVPAAPKHPMLSQYIYTTVDAGATRSFTTVITFAPAASSWDDPSEAVSTVLQPYAKFFQQQYGDSPQYCPSGGIAMRFSESSPRYNRTTNTYTPGSSLWSDDIQGDQVLHALIPAGFDKVSTPPNVLPVAVRRHRESLCLSVTETRRDCLSLSVTVSLCLLCL